MEVQTEKPENRVYKRVEVKEAVRFSFKDPSRFGGCLSYDISEGGVKVRFNEFVPLGTELVMSIQLSLNRVVECIGKVVWVKLIPFTEHYQVGLEFEDLDSVTETRSRIRQFIRYH